MKKVFIFDLDGTVIKSLHIWDSVVASLVGKDMISEFRNARSNTPGAGLEQTYNILQSMCSINFDEAKSLYHKTITEHFENTNIEFVDGFIELHSSIAHRVTTCLVTNAPHLALSIIKKKLNLDNYFHHIYNAEDAGNKFKPDPEIYLYTIKKLGVPKESCIIFEDSNEGLMAAQEAGIDCIKIRGNYHDIHKFF